MELNRNTEVESLQVSPPDAKHNLKSKYAYIYKNYNMIEGTATEILMIISKERNWYRGLISPALASSYKKQLKAGKLLNSTAEKMLYKLGYRKIKKEQWYLK